MRKTATALAVAGLLMGAGTAQAQISVKLGVLNDRSGVYSDLGGEGSVVAARMAVEDFKAESKGIKVEIVSADHQNKPDIGASITRKWYDQDNVDVILDVPTSSVALAVAQITKEKNKVHLNSGAATSDLTGPACTANTLHWAYDTVQLANVTGGAMVRQGGDSWYFLTADYAFGHALERDTSAVVKKNGGKVIGTVRTPFPSSDFSSFLLQAQASKAKVIGLANAGGDTVNAIKQASEFGITQGGQKLGGLLVFVNDIKALGLKVAQGLNFSETFYWDYNDSTRAWSKRFMGHMNRAPNMTNAGVYSSVLHYLRGVEATKSKDPAKVIGWMKANPFEDAVFGKGYVREDGRVMIDAFLLEVKKPEESKGEWDLLKVVTKVPADQAFRPMSEGNCPLVKKN
ncbi:ABC transporter substrate-binding protein [Enterovirga rhinocerotis]|uniref:Amino acid/amide ABC transporter substrate-binding protein (HAAT family) n=1 Tax=Enterovirga rhinocerotis TaxID=1339210 RepID=A0A4R7C9W5_9HYPH|nr:ABC transporter substrate-binding protein [Enterovirga rhinocerotis]TDR94842.1 amino acid/amide ABC transporter substrate-binding protein (HAAT family) [Enterovirga rhinocerotis]